MEKFNLTTDQINELLHIFDFAKNKKISSATFYVKNLFEIKKNASISITFEDDTKYDEFLDYDKFYAMLRLVQRAEAIERLKSLKLQANVLSEFKRDGTLYYSERQSEFFDGILYWIRNNKEYEKVIKEFEKEFHAVVYHAQLTRFEFGLCLSLLYVSQYPSEWHADRNDLEPDRNGIMYPYSYVFNLDTPDYSDIGRIGIARKNGGISRVY